MFKRKNRCYNGGNKHSFKPVYKYVEHGKLKRMSSLFQLSDSHAKELLYNRIYVKDVCEWCGKEIKR